jgi:hypothetical protein
LLILQLLISVADPHPGSGAFLNPGSGIWDGKKTRSGMNIPDLTLENSVSVFWVRNTLILFDADPDPRSGIRDGKFRIRDPGSRINIKHPVSGLKKLRKYMLCDNGDTVSYVPCLKI